MRKLTPDEERWCLEQARREVGLDTTYVAPGWVEIEHPTSPGHTAVVTDEAYDEVWKDLGWRKVLRP